jgi:uncharacterized coiled-coil DUF342 family protein
MREEVHQLLTRHIDELRKQLDQANSDNDSLVQHISAQAKEIAGTKEKLRDAERKIVE